MPQQGRGALFSPGNVLLQAGFVNLSSRRTSLQHMEAAFCIFHFKHCLTTPSSWPLFIGPHVQHFFSKWDLGGR